MNEANRQSLKAALEILNNAHAIITAEAAAANALLVKADETGNTLAAKVARNRLESLAHLLEVHGDRCFRLQAEVEEIRQNIKI
jgi:hypothetical protein